MCRVLGITHFDFDKHEDIIVRFCELARTGLVMEEDPPGHEDGWGLAFYQRGELVVHKSGLNLLEETDRLYDILRQARTSPALILHLRKSAWANTSNTRHAHPFHMGNNVFFHNGVVYDYENLLPQIDLPELPEDARDTEVYFYHVMSRKADNLGQQFIESSHIIQQAHKFSALNCLLSDGEVLIAYRDFTKEEEYYSLYKTRSGNSWMISSEPLDENLEWELMLKQEFMSIDLRQL